MAPLPVTRRPWRGGVTLAEWGVERRTRVAREAGVPARREEDQEPAKLACSGQLARAPAPAPLPCQHPPHRDSLTTSHPFLNGPAGSFAPQRPYRKCLGRHFS